MAQYRYLFDYASTLSFWRLLEEKYRERKRKWLDLNSKTVRRGDGLGYHCIMKTRVPPDDELIGAESKSSTDEDFIDAVMDKEFSDVDSEIFIDPGERKCSLDEEAWHKICQEIISIHKKTERAYERRRRAFLFRLIFVALIAILVLMGGVYCMWKAFFTPSPSTGECTIRCYGGAETIIGEIMETVFPKSNINDEV